MNQIRTWQLFTICVLIWGTTWHAIKYQLGHTAPEVGVAMRFGLAGALVMVVSTVRGVRVRFGALEHGRFALQGAFLYGVSYVCVYHAERYLVSGLVAVAYSASPLVSGLGARLLFRQTMGHRFVVGGVLGLFGIGLIFWPEAMRASETPHVMSGIVYTVGSVLLSTVGGLTASRNRHQGLPFWPSLAWGMLYGALTAVIVAAIAGRQFTIPTATSWWVSLGYLSLFGSVLTFACFLTLVDRLGPGPSGTIGVMTPLLALAISLAREGYRPSLPTAIGAGIAIAGNVLMLTPLAQRKA